MSSLRRRALRCRGVGRPPLLVAVHRAHVLGKQHDRALAAADMLAEMAKDADALYETARAYALCVSLALEQIGHVTMRTGRTGIEQQSRLQFRLFFREHFNAPVHAA